MREVVSTLFRRSTLTFMSLVLALSTLTPLASALTASAITGPFDAEVSCQNEKAVLKLTSRQALLPDVAQNEQNWNVWVQYATAHGSKLQTLSYEDVDTYTIPVNTTEIAAGSTTAKVFGTYTTKEPIVVFGFVVGQYDKLHTYNKTLTANYDAKNCDATAPVATITAPSTALTTNVNVPVSVTATDNYKLNAVSVYLKDTVGTIVQVCNSATNLDAYPQWVTSYTANCVIDIASLADGQYTLVAAVQDRAGNYATQATRSITVDTNKPVVNLVAPTTSLFKSIGTTLSIQATDNIALNKVVANFYKQGETAVYKSTQSTVPANTTSYTHDVNLGTLIAGAALPEGNYYVKFNATDNAGNLAQTKTFEFKVDNTAPTITVKNGYVGNLASKIFSNVSFKLSDANKVDKYVLNGWTSDFTNDNNSDANFQNIKSHLVQGLNTFTLYDVAGNSTEYKFTYDSIAPAVPVLLSPMDNAIQNVSSFWFDWDDVADAVSYEAQFSQSSSTDANGALNSGVWTGDSNHNQPTVSQAWSEGANGTWFWQVRAIDAAGNKSAWSTPWKLTIDKEAPSAPVVTATGVANDATTNDGSVDINWTKPSDDTVKYDYRVWTNAAGSAYNSQASAYQESGLTGNTRSGAFTEGEGSYFVQVRATDAAGNVSPWSSTFTVVYDATAPLVTLETFTANGNEITPDVTATDAHGPLTYAWTGSNANVTLSATNIAEPVFTVSANGTYSYNLTVTDAAGNATVKTFTFTYTAPVVNTFAQPASALVQTNNAPTGNNGFTNVALDDTEDAPAVQGASTEGDDTDKPEILGTTATPESKDGDLKVLGLNWYWWLPILAVGGGMAWWLFALMRRNSED